MASLPRRAFLGVELPDDREAFGPDGMTIAGVVPGGIAERAELVAGDRVVALAGHAVRDLCELGVALRAAGSAAQVDVAFVRAGERRACRVAPVTAPREPDVEYGEFGVPGARLRTLLTRAARPTACVVVLQGIACESVEHAGTPDAPLATLVAAWTEAGFDTVRVDKRGVGDSDGERCDRGDFDTERADARAAVMHARAHAERRGVPLVVFGHSVGGILASLVAGGAASAIVVYGTPVTPWLACLADSVRRQLALRGEPAAVVVAELAKLDALALGGQLNGRSAAYHTQLAAIDPAAAWRGVAVPVLVVRGEHDWVVHAEDQARIAALVAGPATVVDLPHLDHLLGWHADREASLRDYGAGRSDPAMAAATIAWIRRAVFAP